MTKNLVPLIVKELGLEIGEIFTIRNAEFQYRFSDRWVEQDEGDGKWQPCRDELFIELIVGGDIIDKISDSDESVVD